MLDFVQNTSYVCGGRNVSITNYIFTFCDKRNYIYEKGRVQIGTLPLLPPLPQDQFNSIRACVADSELWRKPPLLYAHCIYDSGEVTDLLFV